MKIELPLTAESDWDLEIEDCIRIKFGTYEIAKIPHDIWRPDEDEVSRIAGEWLVERLGLKP